MVNGGKLEINTGAHRCSEARNSAILRWTIGCDLDYMPLARAYFVSPPGSVDNGA